MNGDIRANGIIRSETSLEAIGDANIGWFVIASGYIANEWWSLSYGITKTIAITPAGWGSCNLIFKQWLLTDTTCP